MKEFSAKKSQLGMTKATKLAKTMRSGENELLDQALFIWFRQCREKNVPVTGPILMEKAAFFHAEICPDTAKVFSASTGFQWRFCKRFGIRNLAIAGEKLNADQPAASETIEEFPSLIEGYSLDQIFNCDETGLCYRMLPSKTLAGAQEKRADGMKKAKDRVTVNACANVTGSIKVPLLFIGKSKNPRCFKGISHSDLPVVYRNQRNAWVDTEIFSEWFHEQFAPFVREKLAQLGLEPKAKLFLDNCSAHPEAEDLVTADGHITAHFFRPNITSLVQPMDQGVLESMKRHYRKCLLRDLVAKDDTEMIPFLKSLNMLKVIDRISVAWDHIKPETIRRSWRKLIPLSAPTSLDDPPCSQDDTEIISMLSELGPDISASDLDEWFADDGPGYEHLNDQNIVEYVSVPEDGAAEIVSDEEEMPVKEDCPVSHKAALEAFDKCLTWLRHQNESTRSSTALLLSLRELAAEKRADSAKQTSIRSFFK